MKRHNYTIAEYNEAIELLKLEPNMMEVSRQTGINWNTLRNWKLGKSKSYEEFYLNKVLQQPTHRREIKNPIEYLASLNSSLVPENRNAYYSFILGLYLGDGCISKNKSFSLDIYLDKKYDKMNKYVSFCYGELFGRKATITDRSTHNSNSNCIVVKYSNPNLDILFPHTGVGMKHLRKIELHEWQKEIINPIEFIKGLIYSDGSFYYDKRNKKYFYNFTNCSDDITNMFVKYLNKLGVFSTSTKEKNLNKTSTYEGKNIIARTLANNVNIYRIEDVKKLHDLIGDKNNPIVTYGLEEISEHIKEYDYKTIINLELNLRENKQKTIEEIKILETCECGNSKYRYADKCIKCSNTENMKKYRKFEITKEELESLIKEKPMTEIGKMYGVSDNAVKKRCKFFGIELKSMRGYWAKQKSLEKTK